MSEIVKDDRQDEWNAFQQLHFLLNLEQRSGSSDSTMISVGLLRQLQQEFESESQHREHAEEELDSLGMVLDNAGVPRHEGDDVFSVVGRVQSYAQSWSLTSLRSQLNEAREALKPFAAAFEQMRDAFKAHDEVHIWNTGAEAHITVGDLKRARDFLDKTEKSDG